MRGRLQPASAWVEYDRATGSDVNVRLRELISSDAGVAVTEPVIMEVLTGARDPARERDLRRLLARFALLRFRATSHFDGARRIHRQCRQRGVTLGGLIDCMIAAVAQSEGVALLAHDGDSARMADVMALELDPASLRPD